MSNLVRRTVLSVSLLLCGAAMADPVRDLVVAAQIDNPTTVRNLLTKGLSPNTTDPVTGEPVVIVALREGSNGVVDLLLAHQDLALEQSAPNGNTALMMAAFKHNKKAVQSLLARGARVNRPGWAPLHYAASSGDVPIAALLLAHGATIDARAPGRFTPLMMAAREGQPEVAVLLVQHGADTSLKSDENLTAAEIARRADRADVARSIEQQAAKSGRWR